MKIYYGWSSTIVEQCKRERVRPLFSFYHITKGNWDKDFFEILRINARLLQNRKNKKTDCS